MLTDIKRLQYSNQITSKDCKQYTAALLARILIFPKVANAACAIHSASSSDETSVFTAIALTPRDSAATGSVVLMA